MFQIPIYEYIFLFLEFHRQMAYDFNKSASIPVDKNEEEVYYAHLGQTIS